jgi:hypothetical protein
MAIKHELLDIDAMGPNAATFGLLHGTSLAEFSRRMVPVAAGLGVSEDDLTKLVIHNLAALAATHARRSMSKAQFTDICGALYDDVLEHVQRREGARH